MKKALRTLLITLLILGMTTFAYGTPNTCMTGKAGATAWAGTDPNVTVTYSTHTTTNSVMGVGTIIYIKYTKGGEASVTFTFTRKNPSLSTADLYTDYAYNLYSGAVGLVTVTFTASGNYALPLPVYASQASVVANIVFNTPAGAGGALIVNFMEP